MARTKHQALAQQGGLGGGPRRRLPGLGRGPRRRPTTREDGFDHRHADERDRRVATARTAKQMVFTCPLVMNIVRSHVKGDEDKLNFGCINIVH